MPNRKKMKGGFWPFTSSTPVTPVTSVAPATPLSAVPTTASGIISSLVKPATTTPATTTPGVPGKGGKTKKRCVGGKRRRSKSRKRR